MAILNSSIVTGKLQVTDTIYENGQALSSKYVPRTYTINGAAMTNNGLTLENIGISFNTSSGILTISKNT